MNIPFKLSCEYALGSLQYITCRTVGLNCKKSAQFLGYVTLFMQERKAGPMEVLMATFYFHSFDLLKSKVAFGAES